MSEHLRKYDAWKSSEPPVYVPIVLALRSCDTEVLRRRIREVLDDELGSCSLTRLRHYLVSLLADVYNEHEIELTPTEVLDWREGQDAYHVKEEVEDE